MVRVVRPGPRNEELAPENLRIKWQVTPASDSMCQPVNRVFALTLTDQVRYTCDRVELGLIVIPTQATEKRMAETRIAEASSIDH